MCCMINSVLYCGNPFHFQSQEGLTTYVFEAPLQKHT